MPRDRLLDIGLSYSEVDRAARRRGISIKLTSTQATLLHWYCDAAQPTLDACCADNWSSVSPDWVRSQWDKLGSALAALGLAVAIDRDGRIRLIEPGARQVETPPQAETDDALQAAVRRLTTERDEISALLGEQRAVTRRLQAEADRLRADLSRARQDLRDEIAAGAARLAAPATMPVDEPTPAGAVLITVPVSPRLARWVEDRAARNRLTPGMLVQALIVALERSSRKREAA